MRVSGAGDKRLLRRHVTQLELGGLLQGHAAQMVRSNMRDSPMAEAVRPLTTRRRAGGSLPPYTTIPAGSVSGGGGVAAGGSWGGGLPSPRSCARTCSRCLCRRGCCWLPRCGPPAKGLHRGAAHDRDAIVRCKYQAIGASVDSAGKLGPFATAAATAAAAAALSTAHSLRPRSCAAVSYSIFLLEVKCCCCQGIVGVMQKQGLRMPQLAGSKWRAAQICRPCLDRETN